MSGQLIFSNSKQIRIATSLIFILFCQLLFLSCSSIEEKKVNASVSPIPSPTTNTSVRANENEKSIETKQEDLTDVDKILNKWKSASTQDKESAENILIESRKEFEKNRFTISGQGFLESLMLFPTVEAYVMGGESIILLDLQDQPQNERLKYKTNQFKDGLIYFKAAKEFAKKTDQTAELEKYPKLDIKIQCLETFLANKKISSEIKGCEFISEILEENRIN